MLNFAPIMLTLETQTKQNLLVSEKPPLLLTGTVLPPTQNRNSPQVSDNQTANPAACQKCGNLQGVRHKETLCPKCTLGKLTNHFSSTNKLSPNGWEQLRLFLKLPKRLNEIPFAKPAESHLC